MIEDFRATKVKDKEIDSENIFILQNNTPKELYASNNQNVAKLEEAKEKEIVYISSKIKENDYAIIAKEFSLKADTKKVDFSYYYFCENGDVNVYLYDMKKSFSGEHQILKLVEQWKSSIEISETCINTSEKFSINQMRIGIITENDDSVLRKKQLSGSSGMMVG